MYEGENVCLKGMPPQKLRVIEGQPSCKMLNCADHFCVVQVRSVDMELNSIVVKAHENEFLQKLKTEFQDIFEEPVGLPPLRWVFDHKIPLMLGAALVNIRPYRYPLKQKEIIEQLVQEMLDRGILQRQLRINF